MTACSLLQCKALDQYPCSIAVFLQQVFNIQEGHSIQRCYTCGIRILTLQAFLLLSSQPFHGMFSTMVHLALYIFAYTTDGGIDWEQKE